MVRKTVVLLLAGLTLILTVSPAGAYQATDPYESDPLRLVAFRGKNLPVGTTVVNVWICGLVDDDNLVDIEEAVRILETEHAPLLSWISGGRHRLEVKAAGTSPAIPYRWSGLDTYRCRDRPERQGIDSPWTGHAVLRYRGSIRGSLYTAIDFTKDPVVANLAWAGYVTAGLFGESISHLNTMLTGRGKIPWTTTKLPEVGASHALANTDFFSGFDLGTSAINRYSLGWIDHEDVIVHPGGEARYQIGALGSGHQQMLVFPSASSPHVFDSLGVRLKEGYDANLAQEGVEITRVDQRSSACPDWAKRYSPLCVETYRAQWWPKGPGFFDVGHSINLDEFRIEIVEKDSSSFVLEVTTLFEGRFVDVVDAHRSHRGDIEKLAAAGITVGCNRSGTHFCPDQTVTRAQMAALILRAKGVEVDPNSRDTGFEDVNPRSGLTPYIAKITELGIIPPRSSIGFDPGGPVTRADMAWFMVRAIESMDPVGEPVGLFADIEDPELQAAAEALYSADVTRGCGSDPLIYCPDRPVNRAQMASFLVRAFDLAS